VNGTIGYLDRLSTPPGEQVQLHVSSTAANWRAELVRLLALEIPSFGVPRRVEAVPGVRVAECAGVLQSSAVGSYVRADGVQAVGTEGMTASAIVMPTRPGAAVQSFMAMRDAPATAGWSLGLDAAGRPRLMLHGANGKLELCCDQPVVAGCWYRFTAVVDHAAGNATLRVDPVGTFAANRVATGRGASQTAFAKLPGPLAETAEEPLLIGCGWLDGAGQRQEGFDGRVERPLLISAPIEIPANLAEDLDASFAVLLRHPALVGAWDPADGIGAHGFDRPSRLTDVGPNGNHGRCVNHPTRAVTGHAWTGDVDDFRFAPDHYAAIHFHATAMTDCHWNPQASFTLPPELASGVYAIQLTDSDGHEDIMPLIVTPPRGRATADALIVMSTNSYLAYGNDHVDIDSPRTQVWSQMVPTLDDWERRRDSWRELGLSLYETHSDGTGVCHSSWRRPLLTLRPTAYKGNGPVWQFTGDMQLIDWLSRTGRSVDVVSDRDVHDGGAELLSRYRCVMTGSHPEYPSEEMLDAYESYVGTGGRLMYMGGNGMYWVTGYDPEDEQVIEIRRWGATQAWCAAPGEYHLSFTGRLGGPWRFGGRAPQKTFGVGFVAAGPTTAGSPYLRVAEPGSPASWALDGIEQDEFGAKGVMGGAAGIEIDAVDTALGTPAETVVLSTSIAHTDDMLEARENFNMTSRILGGARNPRVHSDMVLVPREHGGAVFSTGSIAFSGALAADGWNGDVARLLGNIFDRFVSGAPVLN